MNYDLATIYRRMNGVARSEFASQNPDLAARLETQLEAEDREAQQQREQAAADRAAAALRPRSAADDAHNVLRLTDADRVRVAEAAERGSIGELVGDAEWRAAYRERLLLGDPAREAEFASATLRDRSLDDATRRAAVLAVVEQHTGAARRRVAEVEDIMRRRAVATVGPDAA